MMCVPAVLFVSRAWLLERHVWRRSWRERLFGTVPLKKCECGRVCWMDRAEKRYRWTA
jgi:hypothetical protein